MDCGDNYSSGRGGFDLVYMPVRKGGQTGPETWQSTQTVTDGAAASSAGQQKLKYTHGDEVKRW